MVEYLYEVTVNEEALVRLEGATGLFVGEVPGLEASSDRIAEIIVELDKLLGGESLKTLEEMAQTLSFMSDDIIDSMVEATSQMWEAQSTVETSVIDLSTIAKTIDEKIIQMAEMGVETISEIDPGIGRIHEATTASPSETLGLIDNAEDIKAAVIGRLFGFSRDVGGKEEIAGQIGPGGLGMEHRAEEIFANIGKLLETDPGRGEALSEEAVGLRESAFERLGELGISREDLGADIGSSVRDILGGLVSEVIATHLGGTGATKGFLDEAVAALLLEDPALTPERVVEQTAEALPDEATSFLVDLIVGTMDKIVEDLVGGPSSERLSDLFTEVPEVFGEILGPEAADKPPEAANIATASQDIDIIEGTSRGGVMETGSQTVETGITETVLKGVKEMQGSMEQKLRDQRRLTRDNSREIMGAIEGATEAIRGDVNNLTVNLRDFGARKDDRDVLDRPM